MKYCFDIDGTLTTSPFKDYPAAKPDLDAIKEVNRLYDEGHQITLFTARGASSGVNWHETTVKQMEEWGVKYHKLIDQGKPSYDLFIDDKAINALEWKKSLKKKKVGFVASCFDLLHPGHCLMLKEAKSKCDFLIAALQSNPNTDRPEKRKPLLNIEERYILLSSNRYVDKVVCYDTEKDLEALLKQIQPDVRVLGSDYQNQLDKITGISYSKEIYFHDRSKHNWSTTAILNRIKNS